MKYEFISNSSFTTTDNMYRALENAFNKAVSFKISVAFINFAGVQIILDILKKSENRNIKGEILTTNYLHFTELKSIEFLRRFENIEVRFFDSDKMEGFHTKGYIFEYENCYRAIVGSSNLTKSGLKSNIEWNTQVTVKKNNNFIKNILEEFKLLWDKSSETVADYLNVMRIYKKNFSHLLASEDELEFDMEEKIEPNYMQNLALENLEKLRLYDEKKALCIAATGTGKTYLAAFDVRNFNPRRMLFIVHNETILNSAMKTFKKIIPNKSMGFLTGTKKELEKDFIFATIQSLNNCHTDFKDNSFDYIIIDEAHHVTAKTYVKVMEYFKPKFLLGLTATPERCDDGNIYEVFDMNVPVEIRLQEALERNLVVPFHYYGVSDIKEIDYTDTRLTDVAKLTKLLSVERRADYIIEKMNFYGYSGEKRKTLGFCVSVEHAKFMEDAFKKRGIKAISISGSDEKQTRKSIIEKFESDTTIEVIFTVNIFNEGIDIPCVNSILMLRPTTSPIIFTQQLGRGLRHFDGKEFLTVIDFIGNHSRGFLIAIALMGERNYDKESLKVAVKRDFDNLSKNIHIKMEEVCKEEILKQLENENFDSFKYLEAEYKEFKNILKRVPKPIDYIDYTDAPNLLRYIKLQKSYAEFLEKVKDSYFEIDDEEIKIIRELERMLPLKRVYEYAIIHELIVSKKSLSVDDIFRLIGRYVEISDISHCKSTVEHAMRFLNQEYSDSEDLKRAPKMFEIKDEKIGLTQIFKDVLKEDVKTYILDIIDFGILKYKQKFGSKDYGFPFFKLYERYNIRDIALLCNYEKKHSAFRGSGLLKKDNDFFLFVDLNKEEDIKESINYRDVILDREYFQWETPSQTTIHGEVGQKIINNVEKNINLHLFVRKYKYIDSKVQQYIYIGKGDTVEYSGSKPVRVKLKLEDLLSKNIFVELTEKVNIIDQDIKYDTESIENEMKLI